MDPTDWKILKISHKSLRADCMICLMLAIQNEFFKLIPITFELNVKKFEKFYLLFLYHVLHWSYNFSIIIGEEGLDLLDHCY